MKASDYRQHAQTCRDLAKHTPPGEPREQLLEIAKSWDTLAIEGSELVHELAPAGHQNEAALRGFFSSGRETRSSWVSEIPKHSSPPNT